MESDEVRTLGALRAARSVFSRFIERHHGRIANTAGDGLIAEFPSVVEAVKCAIEVQRELGGRGQPQDGELCFRIGLHLGDVIVDGEDLLGEGVNLAARLQSMAEPGGILISQQVYDQVHAKLAVGFDYLGEKRPKNFADDIAVYRVDLDPKPGSRAHAPRFPRPSRPPDPVSSSREEPWENRRARVIRHAKTFGILWAVLLVVDLATGPGFWAHWPVIALATLLAWEAAPLFVNSWLQRRDTRGLVIVGALALINLVTWSGYPWFLWPAGVLIVGCLLYRLRPRSS
jgi:adenylate cyclase